ncbi:helix-turn-helix transcriptional regulator [Aquibacillus sediminis]|uniref:helix-turn-helix transcriptional regulator n=1 Tax=Aquibacillus sediminis TaxID=2574734 RepID=UPI001FEC89D2|nr:helix-turn-helix domain-containing protein [Aquibacillus sediminis]
MPQMNDFTISLQEIKFLAPKLNRGLQLVMVIAGEIVVETNSHYYSLEEKDLLIINRNELYQISGSDHNRVLIITIEDDYMVRNYTAYRNSRFECYSKEVDVGREQLVKTIRKLLAETLISYYRKDDSYRIEILSFINRILLILIRRFKQKSSRLANININDHRLTQIITFIEENYNEPITLEETASKFYLSAGYLSRYFKDNMEIGFTRFLMKVRLEHAVKDLLYTSNTIERIAMNNGFPSAKSFAKLFKDTYQQTPKTYRKDHQHKQEDKVKVYRYDDDSQDIKPREIVEKLRIFLEEEITESYDNTEWLSEELTIDVSQTESNKIVRPWHNLWIGELREALKEGVRSQLLMARKDIGLDYVGVSRLIHGNTIIPHTETDEIIASTSPYYNADFALNFIHKHGFSLFVRVDFREISEDEEHYFKELELFLNHCLNVYGSTFLKSWYFMFYEPFVTAVSEKEMCRVYKKLYKILKQILPSFQVGLFLPFSFEEERTSQHHQWMVDSDVSVDFVGYEANQNDVIDFKNLDDEPFAYAANYMKEKTEKLKKFLRKHQMEKPVHLISWNTLTGNTRFTNGTFFRGALVFRNALEIASDVESLGFWINTEQHEKKGKNNEIPLEGMELYH